MDLSRTVSEINGDFNEKAQFFITPLYFAPPLKGFPLELGIGVRGQTIRMMGIPAEKEITISSAVWIQCTNVTEGQTDGHRATAKTALTHRS